MTPERERQTWYYKGKRKTHPRQRLPRILVTEAFSQGVLPQRAQQRHSGRYETTLKIQTHARIPLSKSKGTSFHSGQRDVLFWSLKALYKTQTQKDNFHLYSLKGGF